MSFVSEGVPPSLLRGGYPVGKVHAISGPRGSQSESAHLGPADYIRIYTFSIAAVTCLRPLSCVEFAALVAWLTAGYEETLEAAAMIFN
jgi:hypothetical protein